jgi:Family of unknown function (DUF5670)
MSKIENNPAAIRQKSASIGKITYVISGILLAGWVVGFLGFHAGNQVHLLLILAMVAISANVIRGE